jgi:hypothetical protein
MLDCQVFGIEQPEDAATLSLAGAAGHPGATDGSTRYEIM